MKPIALLVLISCLLLVSGCQYLSPGVDKGPHLSLAPAVTQPIDTPLTPAPAVSEPTPAPSPEASPEASSETDEDLPAVISEQAPPDSANPDLTRFSRVELPAELASIDSGADDITPVLHLAWQEQGQLYFLQGKIAVGDGVAQAEAFHHWNRGTQEIETILGPDRIDPNLSGLLPWVKDAPISP